MSSVMDIEMIQLRNENQKLVQKNAEQFATINSILKEKAELVTQYKILVDLHRYKNARIAELETMNTHFFNTIESLTKPMNPP